jgi:hypothetical protein
MIMKLRVLYRTNNSLACSETVIFSKTALHYGVALGLKFDVIFAGRVKLQVKFPAHYAGIITVLLCTVY